jgi:hypothetical protein
MMHSSRPFIFGFLSCVAGAATALACTQAAETPSSVDTGEAEINAETDVFGKAEALSVKISAPLSKLFARYKAGQADPPDPNADAAAGWQEPQFSEPGQLVFTHEGAEKTLDLRIYVRGESSKYDCPFPKLKLDFADKEQL